MFGGFKMQAIIVFSMILSVLIAFFAVQNAEIVTISLMWYKLSLSQAVVILGSALLGVLIMLPFDIFRAVKHKFKLMDMSSEIRRLKEELEKASAAEPSLPVMQELPSAAEKEEEQ